MIPFSFWKGDFVPFEINWTTTSNNSSDAGCVDGGWVITEENTRIRFNISDSLNCGGSCPITQTGTATATIDVGNSNVEMFLQFDGMGEAQDSGFENIEFYLDNVLLAKGTSTGGGLGCNNGVSVPITKTIVVAEPYLLNANTQYEFKIDFTTGDNLFHVNAYYEIKLSFA